MNKAIGILILAIIFMAMFIAMAYVAGIKTTIIAWLISIGLCGLICFAVFLITK